MMPTLSTNTQAILLLTAPLITGRGSSTPGLLSAAEYKRLARHLRELQYQPADLLGPGAAELLRACHPVVEEQRLARLLERGFLLSQAVERWQTRAIWVVSRADTEYPRRLKSRLREDAPPVLYGCGDTGLMETGGLAVVGSRHVEDALIEYTMSVGRLAARAERTLVSGGAKGIDQAAMRGALEAGGRACGVLADSLEKTAMNRENRDLLVDGRLVLLSPYDPNAGFNVGNAMQRNKLIYALADAALVVSSDLNKGGTWNGASEQLDKLRLVSVYVRSNGEPTPGLSALREKGALPWPDPKDAGALRAVFDARPAAVQSSQPDLSLFGPESSHRDEPVKPAAVRAPEARGARSEPIGAPVTDAAPTECGSSTQATTQTARAEPQPSETQTAGNGSFPSSPAHALFDAVRALVRHLLNTPMTDGEVAAALDVSPAQATAWLRRLVAEGTLEKQGVPTGYVFKQRRSF